MEYLELSTEDTTIKISILVKAIILASVVLGPKALNELITQLIIHQGFMDGKVNKNFFHSQLSTQ